jgi:hypothetical protein
MTHALGLALNARPVPGTNGRHWRSAAPDELDAAGWAALVADGITTAVDLRNDAESGVAVDRPLHIATLRCPLEDPSDPDYNALWRHNRAHPDFSLWGIEHWPDLWRAALEAIAGAPGGLLIHCAGGRDRTGVLLAVLLHRAGVDRTVVLDDYEAGIRGVEAMLAARGESDHPSAIPRERLEEFVTSYRGALDAMLDRVSGALDRAGLTDAADAAARRLVA